MPVLSEDVWNILYAVSRYLLPSLAAAAVFLILFYILSDSHARRVSARSLPGSGTVGELIVLSGSRDLASNTWFPVPREGVLGSVRSCDLVVPCPGVHAKHLDFSWRDGVGLLICPRTGCEALVNGIPVTCRTDVAEAPLTHGSVLQVGSAVLRLHLFAALDNMPAPAQSFVSSEAQVSGQGPLSAPFPETAARGPSSPGAYAAAVQFASNSFVNDPQKPSPLPHQSKPDQPFPANRWKEDLGE